MLLSWYIYHSFCSTFVAAIDLTLFFSSDYANVFTCPVSRLANFRVFQPLFSSIILKSNRAFCLFAFVIVLFLSIRLVIRFHVSRFLFLMFCFSFLIMDYPDYGISYYRKQILTRIPGSRESRVTTVILWKSITNQKIYRQTNTNGKLITDKKRKAGEDSEKTTTKKNTSVNKSAWRHAENYNALNTRRNSYGYVDCRNFFQIIFISMTNNN